MEELSQRQRIIQHIQEFCGCQPEYLWESTPENAVFRHPGSQKWFALLLRVARQRLGLPDHGQADLLNIKCGPLLAGSLQLEPGFLPAYHMNKAAWVSILLDGPVTDQQAYTLIELSYASVAPRRKPPKSIQPGSSSSRKQPDKQEDI